jgi:hypothetical protein
MRQNNPRSGNAIALVRERATSESDKVSVDFYESRITRGEYNKKRREIAQQTNEQIRVAAAN